MREGTVFGVLQESAQRLPDRPALRRLSATDSTSLTFGQLVERIRAFAAGLWALGLRHGDRVALVAENEGRWLIADLAVLSIGAVDVPRGLAGDRDELEYILSHAQCRFAIVQDPDLAEALVRGSLPSGQTLEAVIQMDLPNARRASGALLFAEVEARGREMLSRERARLAEAEATVRPDDLATLVYTSGTTGIPKGVMLTHRNIVANIAVVPFVLDLGERDCFLSILPTWHMFERTLEYIALSCGACIVYTNKKRYREDLAKEGVTLLGSVPRIWETVYHAMREEIARRPRAARLLFRAAIAVGRTDLEARSSRRGLVARIPGGPARHGALFGWVVSLAIFPLAALAEAVIFRKVRAALGKELRFALSGGASLPPHIDLFFNAVRVPLLNGYGLTETSPVVSVRTPQRNVLGTVGRPVPGTEIKIAGADGKPVPRGVQGLIWIRGPQVMSGYYRNPDETAKVLMEGGWFNSGDLGHLTQDGEIVVAGREKETIVLLSGENVEPRPIEERLLESPLIRQVMVLGQDRKHLTALIVPHLEALTAALPAGAPVDPIALVRSEAAREILRRELDRRQGRRDGQPSNQRIVDFRLLSREFSVEDGTLTPTLKMRRNVIVERYGSLLDELYDEKKSP